MTDQIHAEAIYPAGQSGNPGSKYYDDMISDWAAGKYYEVWYSSNIDEIKKHRTFTIQLEP
jgi:penicillin amidase